MHKREKYMEFFSSTELPFFQCQHREDKVYIFLKFLTDNFSITFGQFPEKNKNLLFRWILLVLFVWWPFRSVQVIEWKLDGITISGNDRNCCQNGQRHNQSPLSKPPSWRRHDLSSKTTKYMSRVEKFCDSEMKIALNYFSHFIDLVEHCTKTHYLSHFCRKKAYIFIVCNKRTIIDCLWLVFTTNIQHILLYIFIYISDN